MNRQSVSVCVSGDRKSLRLKNASLPHDGRRTQAKADDVTRPCALGPRRVEESSKACSSPSARTIFTHGHLPPLTASYTKTLCPFDGAQYSLLTRKEESYYVKKIILFYLKNSRLPMFSRRGSERKNHLQSFRCIFNMLYEFCIYHFH